MRGFSILALAMVVAASASANSITTLFASGNNGASLWTNYFDVTVLNSGGITITAYDVNVGAAGTAFSIDVYTRTGTYSGFETNGGTGWTLVASGNGVAGGSTVPTNVDVNDFFLGAGVTGMAIRYNGATPYYTNGTGSNQSYSDANVALALGTSASTTAGPFASGSGLFTPRVWNGTIYYTPVPEPASMAALGLGAVALIRRRRRS